MAPSLYQDGTTPQGARVIQARRASTCWTCGQPIAEGAEIVWHKYGWRDDRGRSRSPVWHRACPTPQDYAVAAAQLGEDHEPIQPPPQNDTNATPQSYSIDPETGSPAPMTQAPIQPPATQTAPFPTQPNGHAAPSGTQPDPQAVLAQLAEMLKPRAAPLDENRVRALANETYNAGLPLIDKRMALLAKETVQTSARAVVDPIVQDARQALEKHAEALKTKADPAAVERASYEGTRRAIEEANDAGANTATLAVPPPVPSLDPLYQDDNPTSAAIRYCLASGRHLLVSGPSGSGKTYPVRMECAKAGRAVVELSAGDGIGYTHLVGSVTLERDAQGGIVTGWRDGALVRAMRSGALLLLDEADQLPRPLLALLYGILEPGRTPELYVPELGATVRAKAGFTVAATGNTVRDETGLFSGERPSAALLNRLACIPADYLSAKQELAIFERLGLKSVDAKAMRAALEGLRADYDKQALTVCPSTRTGVQVARAMLGQGPAGEQLPGIAVPLSPEKAWTLYLLGALPNGAATKARTSIEAAYRAAGANWS